MRYTIDQLCPEVLVVHEEFSEFVRERVWDALDFEPAVIVIVIGDANHGYERSLDDFVAESDGTDPDTHLREDDIGGIIWTSGTTGRPKGWCHTYRSLRTKAADRGVVIKRSETRMSQTMPSLGGGTNRSSGRC